MKRLWLVTRWCLALSACWWCSQAVGEFNSQAEDAAIRKQIETRMKATWEKVEPEFLAQIRKDSE